MGRVERTMGEEDNSPDAECAPLDGEAANLPWYRQNYLSYGGLNFCNAFSYYSNFSAFSSFSFLCAFSLLSTACYMSILSVGSTFSILSTGTFCGILSSGCAFCIGCSGENWKN